MYRNCSTLWCNDVQCEMRESSCSRNDAFAAAGGKACCPKPVGCANLWDNAASLYRFLTFSDSFHPSYLLDSTCLISCLIGCMWRIWARKAASPETPLMHYTATQQASLKWLQVFSHRQAMAGLRIAKMILPKPGDKFYQPQNLLCQCGPLLSMSIVFRS